MQFRGWSPGGIANGAKVDSDGSLILQRLQDVSPYLERNHYLREHSEAWRGDDNDFWKVASIPNVILEKWLNEGLIRDPFFNNEDDWKTVKRLLNGDYKYLKTAPVTI